MQVLEAYINRTMVKFNLPLSVITFFLLVNFFNTGCNNASEKSLNEKKVKAKLDSAENLTIRAPDSALAFYKEIVSTEKELNPEQLLKVKMGMAECRFSTGEQLEAIKDIQELEKQAVLKKDTSEILKILILGGNFYIKRDQNNESRKVFERGLKHAVAVGDQRYIIRFRQGLATSLFGLNQFPRAIKEFKKVLSEAQILNDSDVLAVTYQNIALVYYHKKDYETSIDYQRHALTYNRKGIQSESYAEMLNNLGAYYSSTDRVDSALQCYLASERIHRGLKNPQGIIRTRFNQANIKLKQRKLKEAEIEFISILEEVKKYNITVGEFYVLNSLSEVKELQGNYPLALALFDSSLNHLLKNNMKYLGTNIVSNRVNLIKNKLRLDTNHIEYKKQREYELQFAVASDDSVLKQLKKEIYPSKALTKKESESKVSDKTWKLTFIGFTSTLLISLLIWQIRKKRVSSPADALKGHTTWSEFPERFKILFEEEFIWKNPACTPSMLSKKLSIDVDMLNQLCSFYFDQAAQEVINKRRISFACQQLDNDHQQMPSMDDLAREAGFEHTSQFYKAFLSITGMQPYEYWNKKTE